MAIFTDNIETAVGDSRRSIGFNFEYHIVTRRSRARVQRFKLDNNERLSICLTIYVRERVEVV